MTTTTLPAGWDAQAHAAWLAGDKHSAITLVLQPINKTPERKPLRLVLQLAYYLFLVGNPAGGAGCLESVRPQHPDDPELLRNLSVCLTRSGQFAPAIAHLQHLLAMQPGDSVAWDSLTHALYRLDRFTEAVHAGTTALQLKDAAAGAASATWQLPPTTPTQFLQGRAGSNVIAFSLWGANPRYLRGALDNALAGPHIYPGWVLRFYVDDTVPGDLQNALLQCGAQVVQEPAGQADRMRLGWRFKVANDSTVKRFLVRDVDSVINPRERDAVQAWIASDYWFHAMRDWWTHTDVMLAGMWGGVAGVLPPLADLLQQYRPATVETPNVDQWFLRDQVWHGVRRSCLVHDRCFTPPGTTPWPMEEGRGTVHMGQDVFAVDPAGQAARLADWMPRLACLK